MVEEEEEEETLTQEGDFDQEFSEEDGDGYSNCFEDGQSQYRNRSRSVSTRKHTQYQEGVAPKKKHRSVHRKGKKKQDADAHDEDPDRRPFDQDFHRNKQNQRLQSHNYNMTGGKGKKAAASGKARRRSGRASTKKDTEEAERASDGEYPPSDGEEEELQQQRKEEKAEEEELQKQQKQKGKGKRGASDKNPQAKASKSSANSSPNSQASASKSSSNSSPNSQEKSPETEVSKEELLVTIARMKKRNELQSKSSSQKKKSAFDTKNLTITEKEVVKIARQDLFQRCKCLTGEKMLRKACKFVLEKMNPKEMDGLNAVQQGRVGCEPGVEAAAEMNIFSNILGIIVSVPRAVPKKLRRPVCLHQTDIEGRHFTVGAFVGIFVPGFHFPPVSRIGCQGGSFVLYPRRCCRLNFARIP